MRKRPHSFLNVAFINAGNDLRSHTLGACSTIGPAGLNFRVRDGNGWNPRGKITDKSRRLAGLNEPRKGGDCEPAAEILSVLREGSLRHLGVACERRTFQDRIFKEHEDETSQLNRLGVAYFLVGLLPISATVLRLCFLLKSVGATVISVASQSSRFERLQQHCWFQFSF